MERRKSKLLVLTSTHKKDRENLFFGILWFYNFFCIFGFIFAVRCLKKQICFVPNFTTRYITYPVLTSTNSYPLFKERDTAIFNFSIYHVFILGM